MAEGIIQYSKEIIDDLKITTNTTYSSDKIEKLLASIPSGNTTEVILGCFDNTHVPTTFVQDDQYYNTTDGKIYKALSTTTWDAGTTPKVDVLYASIDDNKIYAYIKGNWDVYGGNTTKISSKANNIVEDLLGQTNANENGLYVPLSKKSGNVIDNLTGQATDVNNGLFIGKSAKTDNALQKLTGNTNPSEDGLYVKDLSEEVKRINIAQKTVNEDLGYIELRLSSNQVPVLNDTLKFTKEAGNLEFNNNKITLKKDKTYKVTLMIGYTETTPAMTNYPNNQFVVRDTTNSKDLFMEQLSPASQKGYRFPFSNSKTIIPTTDIDIDVYTKTVYIAGMLSNAYTKLFVEEVKRVITIDPVNYIDTNQGIQDAPVGNIIERLEDSSIKHYLLCDGSEHNIGTYPDLEQYFKEMDSVNIFGGDGITTYKLPNIEPKFFEYLSQLPEMTANNAPAPYVASADSIHSDPYQPYMAFNSKIGDAGACWHSSLSASHWLQLDYGAPRRINSFRLKGRSTYSEWYNQMPTSFKLQGSNDGVNFTDIKSFSGLSWGGNIEVDFLLDNDVEYRYYKLADMKSGSDYICFNKVEFAYVIKKYAFIKYEPTYFIGTITGHEQVNELLDTSKDYLFNGLNTTTVLNDLITLKDSIENYDKLEIVGQIIDTSGDVGYMKTELIRVSDLTYNVLNSIKECNNLIIATRSTNALFQADLLFNFKDANTLRIVRTGLYSTSTGNTTWQSFRIKAIRGIRHRYTVSSK